MNVRKCVYALHAGYYFRLFINDPPLLNVLFVCVLLVFRGLVVFVVVYIRSIPYVAGNHEKA